MRRFLKLSWYSLPLLNAEYHLTYQYPNAGCERIVCPFQIIFIRCSGCPAMGTYTDPSRRAPDEVGPRIRRIVCPTSLVARPEDIHSFSFLPDPSNPSKPSIISDACLAVDAIGDDFRFHLIDRYCAIELKEYRRIFRTTDEAGQLDNLSRRFAFFRRTLQTHDTERAKVFPQEWKVGQHMCAKFIEVTRYDQ